MDAMVKAVGKNRPKITFAELEEKNNLAWTQLKAYTKEEIYPFFHYITVEEVIALLPQVFKKCLKWNTVSSNHHYLRTLWFWAIFYGIKEMVRQCRDNSIKKLVPAAIGKMVSGETIVCGATID